MSGVRFLSIVEVFALSVALGADLFSVAVPIGMTCVRRTLVFRAAAVFALFHIGMILTGYYAGHWICRFVEHLGTYHYECPVLVENVAQGIGSLVLAGLGIEMMLDYFQDNKETTAGSHMLQGMSLIIVATSVSVDALAAGFSLGMLAVDLWQLNIILGCVIFFIAVVGLCLGRKIGCWLGGRAEILGGSVLLLLALHLFYSVFV